METAEREDQDGSDDLSFKDRLVAWWEGYDLSSRRKRKPDPLPEVAPTSVPPVAKPPPDGKNRWGRPLWNANRIEVAEKLWGPGFVTPGGIDHVPYIVLPLGLNPAMSVLDLGAGLGGTTRTMASKFGCWVKGLEGSPLLAREGMDRSVKAGLNKHAPIEHFDPEAFVHQRRVDAIVFKEGLFTVADKEQLFDGVELALKPRGQVLFTDYVVEDTSVIDGLAAWAAKEPLEPHLWTVAQMANAFAQRNLDLRISEDITETHRNLILAALNGFREHLAKHSMDIDTKANVMEEVELWAKRLAAFEHGLKIYRFYALKPADGTSD